MTTEDQVDFERALEILARWYPVIALYTPGDDVLAVHFAASEGVLDTSCKEMEKTSGDRAMTNAAQGAGRKEE